MDEVLAIVLAQFGITVVVATFDIVVVWFGVWIPMRNAVAPEDRAYLWRGLGNFAREGRLEHERDMRIRGGR